MDIIKNKIRYSVLVFLILPLYADVDYNSEIQPIFDSNCISCHHVGSGSYNNHGLDLTSYSGVMLGGEDGAVIIPGNSNASDLYDEISDGDMPAGNNPDLSNYHINLIAQWIDEGALGCIDGDSNNENPCNPMECYDGQWYETIIDCAEQWGVPCEGGIYLDPPEGVCCSTCVQYGDTNNDGTLNVIDIVLLVGFILGNEIPNDDEFILSDMNGDGNLDVIDIVVLVNTILN